MVAFLSQEDCLGVVESERHIRVGGISAEEVALKDGFRGK